MEQSYQPVVYIHISEPFTFHVVVVIRSFGVCVRVATQTKQKTHMCYAMLSSFSRTTNFSIQNTCVLRHSDNNNNTQQK